MTNLALVPADMANVFAALSQECGPLQRQRIADAVDTGLRQQSIPFELRNQVRQAVERASAEALPDCFTHPKLWCALRSSFRDWVAGSSRGLGVPAPLEAAIDHLNR